MAGVAGALLVDVPDGQRLDYELYPHQHLALELAQDHSVTVLSGGVRNGKTRAAVCWCLTRMGWGIDAGTGRPLGLDLPPSHVPRVGWIVVPNLTPMWEHIRHEWEDMLGWVEEGGLILERKDSPTPRYLILAPDGGEPWEVYVKSAEDPHRLRAATVCWAWMTEAAMCDEDAYVILQQRVLASRGSLFLESSPQGLNWFIKRVIDRAHHVEDWEPTKEGRPPQTLIRADGDERIAVIMGVPIEANLYLDRELVADMRSDFSPEEAKRELDGRFFSWSGLIWKGFDLKRNTCKAIRPGSLPDGWEVFSGMDFGFGHPTAHLWVAKRGRHRIVVDEYRAAGLTVKEHAAAILANPWSKYVSWRYGDPAAAQARADILEYGISTSDAENDVELGINAVAQGFKAGELLIARNCTRLIEEIGEYHRNEKTQRPVKEKDDLCDALRYAIYTDAKHGLGPLPHASTGWDGRLEIQSDDEAKAKKYRDEFGDLEDQGYGATRGMEIV